MREAQFAQSQSSQACHKAIEQCGQVVDAAMRVQTPGGAHTAPTDSPTAFHSSGTTHMLRTMRSMPIASGAHWCRQTGCSRCSAIRHGFLAAAVNGKRENRRTGNS